MPECPDCGDDVSFEQERMEDPARPGRMTTVTYCPNCGEVMDSIPA